MSTDESFVAHIGWGSIHEEGERSVEYSFATEAERDAFLLGVDEASGWLDYEQLDGPAAYSTTTREWLPTRRTRPR
jgi:hypothetical protein